VPARLGRQIPQQGRAAGAGSAPNNPSWVSYEMVDDRGASAFFFTGATGRDIAAAVRSIDKFAVTAGNTTTGSPPGFGGS
jgi:hypothetical protein